jgi:hypothetical protein
MPMIRGQACRLLTEIAAGFLIRALKEFSDGKGFPEKLGFSLELPVNGGKQMKKDSDHVDVGKDTEKSGTEWLRFKYHSNHQL